VPLRVDRPAGTHVRAVRPTWGVQSAEGYYDSYISAAAVLDLLTTWDEPYDAVVLAGSASTARGGPAVAGRAGRGHHRGRRVRRHAIGHGSGDTTTPTSVDQIRESLRNAGVGDRRARRSKPAGCASSIWTPIRSARSRSSPPLGRPAARGL